MFKKKLLSAAVVALLAGAAHAQLNAPAAAPKPAEMPKPVATVAAEAPVLAAPLPAAAPADVPKAEGVNPFNGKQLGLEVRQRELESAKMETALLEERIKQAALAEDLKTLPLKKSVEAAQATTARLKEEALQKNADKQQGAAVAAAAAAATPAQPVSTPTKPKTRPAKAKKPATDAEQPKDKPAAVAPVLPKVELTSVMSLGNVRSAVLEIDGNILTVKHGEASPMGVVEVLDNQSVRVGGRIYKVHGATLARLTISDPKPVDPKAAPATPTSAQPAPGVVATMPASFGSGRSGTPTLPPLQLPSGVTIIPPSGR